MKESAQKKWPSPVSVLSSLCVIHRRNGQPTALKASSLSSTFFIFFFFFNTPPPPPHQPYLSLRHSSLRQFYKNIRYSIPKKLCISCQHIACTTLYNVHAVYNHTQMQKKPSFYCALHKNIFLIEVENIELANQETFGISDLMGQQHEMFFRPSHPT